jgi:branched-chain amino acid transport system permease protein
VIVGAGIAAAVPVCMAVGYVVERVAYKPLRNAPRLAPLITAIGVSIILQHLALLVWSRNIIAFPQIVQLQLYHLGSSEHAAAISNIQIAIILTSVAMMAGLIALVYRTRIGIAMRATSQNPQVAGLMGVDINKVISFTFVVGAALGAVAGVMVGSYYGIAHYQMGFLLGSRPSARRCWAASAISRGAVLGGILMGLIEALGAGYVGDFTNVCVLDAFLPGFSAVCAASPESSLFGSNYKDVYAFIVLILVLVFRPQGCSASASATGPDDDPAILRSTAVAKWIGIALIAARLLALPFALAMAGHRVGAHHQPRDPLRAAVAGAQHRRRLRRAARPRLHRLLRRRRVRLRAARLPAFQRAPSVVGDPADRRRGRMHLRDPSRGADAQAARRLLAIVTLGFGEIVRIFLNNLSEPFNLTNGPKGITTIDSVKVMGLDFANTTRFGDFAVSGTIKYYFLLLLLLVLVIVVNLRCRTPASAAPGGDQGGRARRALDGHQHAQHEAARLAMAPRSAASRAACSRRSRASSARRASS